MKVPYLTIPVPHQINTQPHLPPAAKSFSCLNLHCVTHLSITASNSLLLIHSSIQSLSIILNSSPIRSINSFRHHLFGIRITRAFSSIDFLPSARPSTEGSHPSIPTTALIRQQQRQRQRYLSFLDHALVVGTLYLCGSSRPTEKKTKLKAKRSYLTLLLYLGISGGGVARRLDASATESWN